MFKKYNNGSIEIIVGPMFSGKTDELIKRVNLVNFEKNKKYIVFKPTIDTRTEANSIISRDGKKINAISVSTIDEIEKILKKDKYDVVAFDEVQFFEKNIVNLVNKLANNHQTRIIIAGLDKDFKGRPFGSVAELLIYADFIDKRTAICVQCGAAASMSQKINTSSNSTIEIGNTDIYEARCRHCYEWFDKLWKKK